VEADPPESPTTEERPLTTSPPAVPPARAELHFHILPGVDDGPISPEVSVELARLAVRDGTSTVVATPHVRDVVVEEIPDRVHALRARLDADGVPLEVRCGGELASDDVARVSDADLAVLSHGPADARWVLLEAPLPGSGASVEELREAARELRERGYEVLLGHPERCVPLFAAGASLLQDELAAGSLLQLNASSLTGRHGEQERELALGLARDGLAAVVASDAHRPSRGPALGAALRALLAAGVPSERAHDMTDAGPRAILDGGLATRRAGRPGKAAGAPPVAR
jgi:protein-tyrosine phosphatase